MLHVTNIPHRPASVHLRPQHPLNLSLTPGAGVQRIWPHCPAAAANVVDTYAGVGVCVCVCGTKSATHQTLRVWTDVWDSGRSVHMGRGVGVTLITDPTLYTGQISRAGQDKEAWPTTAECRQILWCHRQMKRHPVAIFLLFFTYKSTALIK